MRPLPTSRNSLSRRVWVASRRPLPGQGQSVELKTVWRDGTSHLLFEPVEFLEKLAAIIPRPAVNLVLYHGILALHARWRSHVVRSGRPGPDVCRKQIVEPVFGQIKHACGFRQFLRRGLRNVGDEWALICTAHNVL